MIRASQRRTAYCELGCAFSKSPVKDAGWRSVATRTVYTRTVLLFVATLESWSRLIVSVFTTGRLAGALAQRLQPAADMRLVVAVGVAEAPFEICLLARDDDVTHGDRQRQREDEDPWAARSYADAGIEEEHADVDR